MCKYIHLAENKVIFLAQSMFKYRHLADNSKIYAIIE